MLRIILPALLALAGCATPAPSPVQIASTTSSRTDPALMQAFFGTGSQRIVSPVIRCPVRCQARQ